MECPWRLIHHDGIVVSGDDRRQLLGLTAPIDAAAHATSSPAGVAIRRVEIRETTADLLIDLDGDRRLEIIPFSPGYESWQISSPGGKRMVAQGGGQLSAW